MAASRAIKSSTSRSSSSFPILSSRLLFSRREFMSRIASRDRVPPLHGPKRWRDTGAKRREHGSHQVPYPRVAFRGRRRSTRDHWRENPIGRTPSLRYRRDEQILRVRGSLENFLGAG